MGLGECSGTRLKFGQAKNIFVSLKKKKERKNGKEIKDVVLILLFFTIKGIQLYTLESEIGHYSV